MNNIYVIHYIRGYDIHNYIQLIEIFIEIYTVTATLLSFFLQFYPILSYRIVRAYCSIVR